MPVKYYGEDASVCIIVDPQFEGELFAMAQVRPIWIVNSGHNKEKIDAVWQLYSGLTFYEVNRYPYVEPYDSEEMLFDTLGVLDDHEYVKWRRLVVHGLQPAPSFHERLAAEGFSVAEEFPGGFLANRIPGVRERLIGRC